MTLHHVGIVVGDLRDYGSAYASALGLIAESGIVEDPIQKVRVQFWRDTASRVVELIEPSSPDSPVMKAWQKGGGLNHLCYEVADIEAEMNRALDEGALLAAPPAPAAALEGRRVAFLYFRKLGLIEFLEAPRA